MKSTENMNFLENKVEPFKNEQNEKLKKIEIVSSATLNLCKELLYNSTGQALLKIYTSSSKLFKFFWISCLLVACSLCSYFVFESLDLYFSVEVNTITRTYSEIASKFPKIYICNKNLYTTKYAYDIMEKAKNQNLTFNLNTLNNTNKIRIQHTLKDILNDCMFNGQKCTPDDFLIEFDKR